MNKYELEAVQVVIENIKLDVEFYYNSLDDEDDYISIENVYDDHGEQDLMPIIHHGYLDDITKQIQELYLPRLKRG